MPVIQRQKTTLLWGIVATLSAIITAALGYIYYSKQAAAHLTPSNILHPQNQLHSDQAHQQESSSTATTLLSQDLLQTSLPSTTALAKDELSRLDDVQQRLNQQENILKAQLKDADQLIKLKQEQIHLLEQQLIAQHE